MVVEGAERGQHVVGVAVGVVEVAQLAVALGRGPARLVARARTPARTRTDTTLPNFAIIIVVNI